VARLGGDEFGVLAVSNATAHTALQVAGKLKEAVVRPFAVNGHEISLGVSIAISPDRGTTVSPLLQRADEAMYIAKRSGGGARLWQAREVASSDHRGVVRTL
jgi:diguanylate cyclase (GGDEF)-like protein